MSQKVSRKTAVNEEKEKVKRHSPVKEMKKKMAANAEKEKQAAEKSSEKQVEKTADKPTDKVEKPAEKVAEKAGDKTEKHDKNEKPDKAGDKKDKVDKSVDKKSEKQKEEQKPEPQPEKSKADSTKEDKSGKPEKQDTKKPEPTKTKQNGRDRVLNGVSDSVPIGTNGTDEHNGTVSADSEDDDVMLVIDDNDQDDIFPELTYEETSDGDCFELPTPENGPSRSLTRRSQVKSTRTPETPRPASDKQADRETDDPKDKLLKLKEDATVPTDRRLRSSNSPKPQEGKKLLESPKKNQEGLEKVDEKDEDLKTEVEVEIEVVLDVPSNEGEEPQDKERSKTDTNYSKSRVKVSPYRRSMRIADQTNTSLQANYTGNNTTMEMDITESSSFMEDAPLDDSSYLRGLRSIRGRSSYKPLKEITLKHVTANRSVRSAASTSITSPASDAHNRPTGTVVGRKRKPDTDDVEVGVEAATLHAPSKRMRVLERLAEPFRRVAAAAALPSAARRNAEIVGINTDLPLTAPVSSPDTFDPESLKPSLPLAPLVPSAEPVAVPLGAEDKDSKRCVIM